MPTTLTTIPVPLPAWLCPGVPSAVHSAVAAALEDGTVPPDLRVGPGLPNVFAHWVYAACLPFPSFAEGVQWADVQRFWAGEPSALIVISGDATPPTLFVTPDTLAMLQWLLGQPSDRTPITTAATGELADQAWAARPHAWTIVPFDELEPRWKVLSVDASSVLDAQLDVESYPLMVRVGAEGAGSRELSASLLAGGEAITNRNTDRMTTLIMTGVTALVRVTAKRMEQNGILYPAAKIGGFLSSADLTHISNEIPFARDCPPPDPQDESLVFCSDPSYIELLREVGTDVVELTGNHFQDYGSEATLETLEMYRQEGWPYYGGGEDLADARKPTFLEHNGNSFSFIGCNPVGPDFAWATADSPGAAPCDFDYMHSELARLKSEVDVPIATWQYWEFYQYEPTPQQQAEFRAMVDAGAAIVSGSQAHHPQAIEFYKGRFIHYGLGNLFFDQMWSLGTRQQVVDRHFVYEGRHISTELHTFMLEDYSQPRPMTVEERHELLSAIFAASGW